MHSVLIRIHPYYWFTNWPISVLGIAAPAAVLAYMMFKSAVQWRRDEPSPDAIAEEMDPCYKPQVHERYGRYELLLSVVAISLLGIGVILHSIFNAINFLQFSWPLWLMLAPAGIVSLINVFCLYETEETSLHIRTELPVWLKLMVIFSLLWLMINIFSQYPSLTAGFFLLPFTVQYVAMVILSLLSSITDNVALAGMQGSLLVHHPIAIWQMRLLFILLTWAGGLTAFGCLQSLALNSQLKLSMRGWLREVPIWAGTSLLGGLVGLALIKLVYPAAF